MAMAIPSQNVVSLILLLNKGEAANSDVPD